MCNIPDSVEQLRAEGYAVVIFTPEELREAPPWKVEERMIEKGWEAIHFFNERVEDPT